jgi:hypothetical protein
MYNILCTRMPSCIFMDRISKLFCKDGGGGIKGVEGREGGELEGENKSYGLLPHLNPYVPPHINNRYI